MGITFAGPDPRLDEIAKQLPDPMRCVVVNLVDQIFVRRRRYRVDVRYVAAREGVLLQPPDRLTFWYDEGQLPEFVLAAARGGVSVRTVRLRCVRATAVEVTTLVPDEFRRPPSPDAPDGRASDGNDDAPPYRRIEIEFSVQTARVLGDYVLEPDPAEEDDTPHTVPT